MEEFRITPPIVQSAMAGISDKNFCQKLLNIGMGMVILGGYSIDEICEEGTKEIIKRGRKETLIPLNLSEFEKWAKKNAQLQKKNPNQIVGINLRLASINQAVIKRLATLRKHVDVLEINAHCRQPEILAYGGGQALLSDLHSFEDILQKIRGVLQKEDIGIKIRGYILEKKQSFIEISEKYHLKYIHIDCMEPGEDKANIKLINDFSSITNIPVIGNNSVRNIKNIEDMIKAGAVAVSIARPLIKNTKYVEKLIKNLEV